VLDPSDAALLPLSESAVQVLITLLGGPVHGYGIAKALAARGVDLMSSGNLYTMLRRLSIQGLIERMMAEKGPLVRPKVRYRLSARGERVLVMQLQRYQELLAMAQPRQRPGLAAEETSHAGHPA
jgi:PadR family transcriptional regulator